MHALMPAGHLSRRRFARSVMFCCALRSGLGLAARRVQVDAVQERLPAPVHISGQRASG